MINDVLVDTGPLVAIMNRSDTHHGACVDALSLIQPPLITTWPVLTEAAYLLRHRHDLVRRLLQSVPGGLLHVEELGNSDCEEMERILVKYSDQQFQLADLSLMHLANRLRITTIFSLDRTDFSVFRTANNEYLHIVP